MDKLKLLGILYEAIELVEEAVNIISKIEKEHPQVIRPYEKRLHSMLLKSEKVKKELKDS